MILRALCLTVTTAFLCLGTITAQLDPTFGTNGVTTATPGTASGPIGSYVLPDGKIFVISQAGCCGGGSQRAIYFFKFNSDGTPDTTYDPAGFKQVLANPFPTALWYTKAAVRQPDGKIVLVGEYTAGTTDGFVARFNEDGTIDTSFRGTGYHLLNINSNSDQLLSVVIQPDGKILAAGQAKNGTGNANLVLVRYLPDGTLDSSFGGSGSVIHSFVGVTYNTLNQFLNVTSTGKILVGNQVELTGGGKMRRFNSDGSVDNSFTVVPFAASGGFVRKLAYVQSDDKILVSGLVTKTETLFRTNDDVVVNRYNADGTPDTGFGNGGSVSFDITSYLEDEPLGFAVMPDGQIVVAVETDVPQNRSKTSGFMLSYAKLSPSGEVVGKFLATNEDNSLTEPCFLNVQPDGKIVTAFRAA